MLDDSLCTYVPVDMYAHPAVQFIERHKTLERAAVALKYSYVQARDTFAKVRCHYDFEFWTATCVTIKAKKPGSTTTSWEMDEKKEEIPTTKKKFILNKPQLKLLFELEKMRLAGVPIRIILLKARQWGGSTLVQIYMAWIQLFHRKDWNSMIVGDKKDKAHNIRAMYKLLADNHPAKVIDGIERLVLQAWEGSQNFRQIKERGCIIGVGSVENPDAPAAFTFQMLHLSEVGLWKSTPKVNAEEFISVLEGAFVEAPYTMMVKESTARGVGTYFHKAWQKAIAKKSGDVPIFVSWFENPDDYNVPVKNVSQFVSTFDDYEWFLWESGATVEHIAWYREKLSNAPSKWQMQREYPTTAEEAFQSTGSRIFAPDIVLNMRKFCKPPIAAGNLLADAGTGEDALKGIRFVESPKGPLNIWQFPEKLKGKIVTNRYCAFLDTGGTRPQSDYSSLTILDRIMTLYGGVPEVVCEFHGHLDEDLVAWYSARVCRWYYDALLAVEVNKLYKASGDNVRGFETGHGTTVLDEIKDYYQNLFYRVRPEQIQEKWDGVLGFHTNTQTKDIIIKKLNAALRDEGFEERSLGACDEFDMYELKPDGKMGAVEGQHDDMVISRAGAIWLSEQMDAVNIIDEKSKHTMSRKGGYAVYA
jgi:hypothetical protein